LGQLDALLGLAMKLEMDLKNEITDMEDVIMINPLDERKSIIKCRDNTKIYDFFTQVYPEKIVFAVI
jgi:hypothetical protein